MESTALEHKMAAQMLWDADYEGALRLAGPMLEANPADTIAWYYTARAMLGMGKTEVAMRNLKSIATALAKQGQPILSLAIAKEFEDQAGDATELIGGLAKLYGAGSQRVEEAEMSPPPLSPHAEVTPWEASLVGDELLGRAGGAMAVSWGEALTIDDNRSLPFVPLLSTLAVSDFVLVANVLERKVFESGQTIIEQGSHGDSMYIIAQGEVAVIRRFDESEQELAKLGPGAFFGEMALVSRTHRAADVRASERTVVLCAHKAQLDQLAISVPQIGDVLIAFCHARMLENLMRVSKVFEPVPVERRPDVIACFGTDYREAGDVIIVEGQAGPGLFLVVSGQVQVLMRDGTAQTLVATLGPGDLFGEISLVMRKPSTASVVAVEDTALLFLSVDEFNEATKDFPELLKGTFDIAVKRDSQNRSILANDAAAADDMVLI